jgi:hypothetical protein
MPLIQTLLAGCRVGQPILRPIRSRGDFDPGLGIYENIAVPEFAKQEYRNRGDRHAVVARDQIGRRIELADVERKVLDHPAVPFGVRQLRYERQVGAVHRNRSIAQCADVIEVVAGNREVYRGRHG